MDVVRAKWDTDFKKRTIIDGFMKDHQLGLKRLTSMPDRVTNTINVEGKGAPRLRPTVINMYDEDLSSVDAWWPKWKRFMFEDDVTIYDKKDGRCELRKRAFSHLRAEFIPPCLASSLPSLTPFLMP